MTVLYYIIYIYIFVFVINHMSIKFRQLLRKYPEEDRQFLTEVNKLHQRKHTHQ